MARRPNNDSNEANNSEFKQPEKPDDLNKDSPSHPPIPLVPNNLSSSDQDQKDYEAAAEKYDVFKTLRPFNKDLKSKELDPKLFNNIKCLHIIMVTIRGASINNILVTEGKLNKTCYYVIESKSNGLSGYIGRDNASGEIIYMVRDKSRLKWAEMEGFTEANGFSQNFVYEQIGVFRCVRSIGDFANFILGGTEWQFKGDYIKS